MAFWKPPFLRVVSSGTGQVWGCLTSVGEGSVGILGPGPARPGDKHKWAQPLAHDGCAEASEEDGTNRCGHLGLTPVHSPTGSVSNSSFQSIKSVSNSTASGKRASILHVPTVGGGVSAPLWPQA